MAYQGHPVVLRRQALLRQKGRQNDFAVGFDCFQLRGAQTDSYLKMGSSVINGDRLYLGDILFLGWTYCQICNCPAGRICIWPWWAFARPKGLENWLLHRLKAHARSRIISEPHWRGLPPRNRDAQSSLLSDGVCEWTAVGRCKAQDPNAKKKMKSISLASLGGWRWSKVGRRPGT